MGQETVLRALLMFLQYHKARRAQGLGTVGGAARGLEPKQLGGLAPTPRLRPTHRSLRQRSPPFPDP
jgi:hypothetical protein